MNTIKINEQYASTAKLNDLYWSACEEYTCYIQFGLPVYKEKSLLYFARYKERGGKRKELIMH